MGKRLVDRRVQVVLDDEMRGLLKRMSEEMHLSLSALIRQLLNGARPQLKQMVEGLDAARAGDAEAALRFMEAFRELSARQARVADEQMRFPLEAMKGEAQKQQDRVKDAS